MEGCEWFTTKRPPEPSSNGVNIMLVLSRKKNESIIIADNIKLTVIEIRGGLVRLGVEAPKDVTIHRREVYEAIQIQSHGKPKDDLTAALPSISDEGKKDQQAASPSSSGTDKAPKARNTQRTGTAPVRRRRQHPEV